MTLHLLKIFDTFFFFVFILRKRKYSLKCWNYYNLRFFFFLLKQAFALNFIIPKFYYFSEVWNLQAIYNLRFFFFFSRSKIQNLHSFHESTYSIYVAESKLKSDSSHPLVSHWQTNKKKNVNLVTNFIILTL